MFINISHKGAETAQYGNHLKVGYPFKLLRLSRFEFVSHATNVLRSDLFILVPKSLVHNVTKYLYQSGIPKKVSFDKTTQTRLLYTNSL